MTNRWVPASAGMTDVAEHPTSAASLFPFYFRDPREACDQELRAPVIPAKAATHTSTFVIPA